MAPGRICEGDEMKTVTKNPGPCECCKELGTCNYLTQIYSVENGKIYVSIDGISECAPEFPDTYELTREGDTYIWEYIPPSGPLPPCALNYGSIVIGCRRPPDSASDTLWMTISLNSEGGGGDGFIVYDAYDIPFTINPLYAKFDLTKQFDNPNACACTDLHLTVILTE